MEQNGIITKCSEYPLSDKLLIAISRFHDHSETDIFAIDNFIGKKIQMGSALKYGRIALGKVDAYLRIIGTSEWDTAAGQAILEAAGGFIRVTTFLWGVEGLAVPSK